jgi:serine/threonine protein phosphatase PrpC
MSNRQWHSVARTHVGMVRRHNEDSFLERPDIGLWVVADGMGGMTAGEVASGKIVTALDGIAEAPDARNFLQEIRTRLAGVNAELRTLAAQDGAASVIGSTVVGLVLHSGHFAGFWAGDSRLYRHRGGELDRLTRDHSLVQEMVDAGLLAADQAEHHPHASVIQRAVGADDTLELEIVHARAEQGDVFLLCSDGLTRMVSDEELEERLAGGAIEEVAAGLLDTVLERGARDNVTIILVAYGPS